MQNSLNKEIIRFLRQDGGWVHGGRIARLALELGYDAENGKRTARRLSKLPFIQKKIENRCIHYRFVAPTISREEEERLLLMEAMR